MSSPAPLQPGRFYHIYNRGVNGENLFREDRNYRFFLDKYAYHVAPVVRTFAYALRDCFDFKRCSREHDVTSAERSTPTCFF